MLSVEVMTGLAPGGQIGSRGSRQNVESWKTALRRAGDKAEDVEGIHVGRRGTCASSTNILFVMAMTSGWIRETDELP